MSREEEIFKRFPIIERHYNDHMMIHSIIGLYPDREDEAINEIITLLLESNEALQKEVENLYRETLKTHDKTII